MRAQAGLSSRFVLLRMQTPQPASIHATKIHDDATVAVIDL
jgi:hypothetical protein